MDVDILPDTLAEVRQAIDELDSQLISLLARRQQLVAQAGRLKPKHDAQAVAAPERVAQVLKARREAGCGGRLIARCGGSRVAGHDCRLYPFRAGSKPFGRDS